MKRHVDDIGFWVVMAVLAVTLVFGFANGITIPSILAILSRIAPPDLRAVSLNRWEASSMLMILRV